MGPRGLRLAGERGQCGSLSADGAPGQFEAFAAEQRQEGTAAFTGIAGEFPKKSVFLSRRGSRNFEHRGLAAGRRRHLERHLESAAVECALDEHDRIPVCAERRQTVGKHPQVGVGHITRQNDILRPPDRLHGQGSETAASVLRRDGLVGHQQHPAGRARDGGEAGPIHLRSDSDARERDSLRPQFFENLLEFGHVDAVQPRAVADVHDGTRGRGGFEEVGRRLEHADDIRGPKRRAVVERKDGRAKALALRRGKAFPEWIAADVDCRQTKSIRGPGFFQNPGERCARPLTEIARLAGRGVDQHDDVGRFGRGRMFSAGASQGDRGHGLG